MLACLCNDFLRNPWLDLADLLTRDYFQTKKYIICKYFGFYELIKVIATFLKFTESHVPECADVKENTYDEHVTRNSKWIHIQCAFSILDKMWTY